MGIRLPMERGLRTGISGLLKFRILNQRHGGTAMVPLPQSSITGVTIGGGGGVMEPFPDLR